VWGEKRPRQQHAAFPFDSPAAARSRPISSNPVRGITAFSGDLCHAGHGCQASGD
jgi:hypothetical protein